jgi:two-component sensor histidine kinase
MGILLDRLHQRGVEVDRQSLEAPFRMAVEEQDLSPLLVWASKRGEYHATSGHPLQTAVEEAMALGQEMERAGLQELSGPQVASALVSAAVEGYFTTTGKASGDDFASQELKRRLAELTALHRINSAANSSLKLSDMLNETVQAVVAVTGADVCSIFLYEPEWDQLVLAATSGLSQDAVGKVRLRLGEGIVGWAAQVGKPVAVRNAWEDPRFKYTPSLGEEQAVSMLAVPIVLFTKEKLVGVIVVQTYHERDFSDSEIKFLETVAGEIAIAIENARLYEQTDARLQQKVAELSTLQGVSAHIASTLNLPEVLTLIAYQAAHLVRADAAAIYELHGDAGLLELVAQYDLQDPNFSIHQSKIGPRVVLDVQQSDIARAIQRGIPVALPADADAHLGVPFASEGYRSAFCVPLIAPRAIMGGICLYSREERTYTAEQVELLDAFAREAAIALENSRLYDAALRGLRAKSAMLQEMNHRVRNSLQTVAGLLSMQLRRMDPSSEAATAVRESIARIQSMAAVHDLMVGGDVESVSLYELARKVAEAAASTLTRPGFDLTLTIDPDAECIRVGSHEATLLALLFNELISNAILHGFEDRERGEVTIRAWVEREGSEEGGQAGAGVPKQAPRRPRIVIEVEDDGVGLPEGFDLQKHSHLGLNIVQTLVVSDLRGEFKIERGKKGGTKATISFTPPRTT